LQIQNINFSVNRFYYFYFYVILLFLLAGVTTTQNDECIWSEWSECSASCGSGFQIRQKIVSEDRDVEDDREVEEDRDVEEDGEADIRNLDSFECQGTEETEKRNCFLSPCQGIVDVLDIE
jgi:hypothetical protein